MSDAITDIGRDQQRADLFDEFIDLLIEYLRAPNKAMKKKVIAKARETDSVSRGYWGGSTDLTVNLEENLKKLLDYDPKIWEYWLRFLFRYDRKRFETFKKISPFKNYFMFAFNGDESALEIISLLRSLGQEKIPEKIDKQTIFLTLNQDADTLVKHISIVSQ